MPKKLKKTSTTDSEKKLQKKPNLEEYLKQASNWHKRWGSLCNPPLDNIKVYLDYQKMFYMSTINDMTDSDYNKFIIQQSKSVIERFNKLLKK